MKIAKRNKKLIEILLMEDFTGGGYNPSHRRLED